LSTRCLLLATSSINELVADDVWGFQQDVEIKTIDCGCRRMELGHQVLRFERAGSAGRPSAGGRGDDNGGRRGERCGTKDVIEAHNFVKVHCS
jgi:hypothetical protein